MAEAMGFSSFGGQGHPQKKRRYNPHADAAVVGGSDRRSAAAGTHPSTGSNSTPLGEQARRQGMSAANDDEIDLEGDGNEGPVSETVPAPAGQANPPGQARPAGLPQRPPPQAGSGFPLASRGAVSHGMAASTQGESGQLAWHEGYFDPMSITNPWEKLEKMKGLDPKGTWGLRAA